jgi:chemotaxis protein MotB
MQRQLQETTAQLQQSRIAHQSLQSQASGLQASMSLRGGASLKANNSLLASASSLQIPGTTVQPDGDLIRIRIAADQLFAPGSAQLNPTSVGVLDQVGATLIRQFSRQRVAVEGHTDHGPLYGGSFTTPYQLASAQAQAVMDSLTRRSAVPAAQLFMVAHGSNHPRADNQSPAGRAENRRIEIVIYPETF